MPSFKSLLTVNIVNVSFISIHKCGLWNDQVLADQRYFQYYIDLDWQDTIFSKIKDDIPSGSLIIYARSKARYLDNYSRAIFRKRLHWTKLFFAKYYQLTAEGGAPGTKWQSSDIERRKFFKICVLPGFCGAAEGKQARSSTAALFLWLAKSFSILLYCLWFSWNSVFEALSNWIWMDEAEPTDEYVNDYSATFEPLQLRHSVNKCQQHLRCNTVLQWESTYTSCALTQELRR